MFFDGEASIPFTRIRGTVDRIEIRRLRKKSNFCVALHPSSLPGCLPELTLVSARELPGRARARRPSRRIVSTPHSSGFARLAFEAFYFVACFPTFYVTIKAVQLKISEKVLQYLNK
jgi:hypothetical protein